MGSVFIGQELSLFAPAVCRHKDAFHMVYVAANSTHELLHAVSTDGFTWTRKNNIRQSSKAAPAMVSFHEKLRVVFVADNNSNDLLQCTYDDPVDVWTDNVRLNESSPLGPSLLVGGGPRLLVYFVQNSQFPFLRVADIT